MKREWIFGLLTVAEIAMAAFGISQFLPSLGTVTIAIILGILAGNLSNLGQKGAAGVKFAEKKMLNAAIVLMGFELKFASAANLGIAAPLVVAGVILLSLFLGLIIAKMTSIPAKLALLLGIGSGICGSAAIAVCAPVIKAGKEDTGLSIASVNFLGALAIFFLPLLAAGMGMGEEESALLLGGTIQAVGQTMAAGLRMGDTVAELSVVVKMGRVLLLGVVALVLGFVYRSEGPHRFPLPPFIAAFVAAALLVNFLPLPAGLLHGIDVAKKLLFYPAMAAIGMGIRFKTLTRLGLPALIAAAAIFGANIIFVVILGFAL